MTPQRKRTQLIRQSMLAPARSMTERGGKKTIDSPSSAVIAMIRPGMHIRTEERQRIGGLAYCLSVSSISCSRGRAFSRSSKVRGSLIEMP